MNQARRKEEQLVRLKAQGLALQWVPGPDTVLPLLQPVGNSVGTYVTANAWISSKLFTLTWITRAITRQLGCLVRVLVSSLGPTQSTFPEGRAATSHRTLRLETQAHAEPLCCREVQIWRKQVQISLKPTLFLILSISGNLSYGLLKYLFPRFLWGWLSVYINHGKDSLNTCLIAIEKTGTGTAQLKRLQTLVNY